MTDAKTLEPSKTISISREEAIQFLEMACRNWSHVPALSEDDIGDVASELLRFVNMRLAPKATA